jgi:predicted KAP-like P-loop ATPase
LPDCWGCFGYSDIVMAMLGVFIIFCLRAYLCVFVSAIKQPKKPDETNYQLLSDVSIEKPEYDLLDYAENAKKLANDLTEISGEHSFSIGINGAWGAGKTSFMNLVEESLEKEDFMVIKFNPRQSKDCKNIQADFFNLLYSSLKPYNASVSLYPKLLGYLKSIDVAGSKGIMPFLLDFQKIWNRKSEKEKVNSAIEKLNKRIVVFIDDFDRLLSEEIIEVFKLIDVNASFSNMIFLTAYDRSQLEKILKNYSESEGNNSFTEKFFTLEMLLPLRPYDKIFDYLCDKLWNKINVTEEKRMLYEKTIDFIKDILQHYLVTIRDVKRFLNLFSRQYPQIKDEVDFRDYFLLSLIQYKYPNEHNRLYYKEYIREKGTQFVLNKTIEPEPKSKSILKLLFPQNGEGNIRSINYCSAFNIYFDNFVYDGIELSEMNEIFK